MALDRFSNTTGRPSWFVHPCRCQHSRAPPLLHECYHWHPDWSIGDTLFWLLVLFFYFGCFLGWLIILSGVCFLLHAGNDWIWWCTGSHAHCGGSLVNPCASLLHWSFPFCGVAELFWSQTSLLLFEMHGLLTLYLLFMQTLRVS
jgi:hypothetical protein